MDKVYDDTNTAVVYNPRESEQLLSTGKVNIDGEETRILILKTTLPDGTVIRDVYTKDGTLFQNEDNGNNNPLFSGPFKHLRLAFWLKKNERYGNFLSGVVEPQRDAPNKQEPPEQNKAVVDDDIPF